ncbi:2'-5' RNA ligase family protein [Enterovirga rhinocerotis]|uniref:2'-5' RNA ligase n=1 Tax=Enterovirga rhinocerotis TaxID=1339210 RepID=A0A4R7C7B0_9HYPH|nr:2'-5' RNA ligase family protein [Enterovirga rhinocerotis]TDR93135.1 2'-5' RNA ligase [Enterovirga rhinocerotis]
MSDAAPLILTLALDGSSFAGLDALRRRHFPPERNRVPAHLTLFHAIPGREKTAATRDLGAICKTQKPFPLAATGWTSLGHGTALSVSSPALVALRQALAREWRDWLTPQDSARFAPHVTVQNKVSPQEAAGLLRELRAGFRPFEMRAEGVLLWRYLDGPWELLRRFPFAG